MSSYNCTARTNYFRVKDLAAFTAFAEKFRLRIATATDAPHAGMVALFDGGFTDNGSFPSIDPETDEEIDFTELLSKHLADGSVAVVVEAGAEAERYVAGWATAIDAKGQTVTISLEDIYELAAAKLGGEITKAEY